jgi:TetR/AcrR family transcriptional regulator, mexJK operon transcriptional repressor
MDRTADTPNPVSTSTRMRVMDAAAQLFRAQGYEASMDAIATAADVSKQTLYNQFGSKEELFKSIITARSAAVRAPLAEPASHRHPREVLLDFKRQYYALAYTAQALGFYRTIVAAGQRFPEIGLDFYEAGPKQTQKMLADWMAREDRFGRLDTGDPALAAEHFLSLIMGHMQTRGLLGVPGEPSAAELERRARFCVDAFMRAFARVDRP